MRRPCSLADYVWRYVRAILFVDNPTTLDYPNPGHTLSLGLNQGGIAVLPLVLTGRLTPDQLYSIGRAEIFLALDLPLGLLPSGLAQDRTVLISSEPLAECAAQTMRKCWLATGYRHAVIWSEAGSPALTTYQVTLPVREAILDALAFAWIDDHGEMMPDEVRKSIAIHL